MIVADYCDRIASLGESARIYWTATKIRTWVNNDAAFAIRDKAVAAQRSE
jgi:hypothetical protein